MESRGKGATGPEPRISIGVPALDTILAGGLMPHRPYLIVGPSGTGKTTLALEFLCEGVKRGERCLLVTLEEPPNEMRVNHRGLAPELDQVYVFDAIPDVMRYERAPFKDIAAVREAVPFSSVPLTIRKTPELSSVEVTFTALEQTLKMEMARRSYTRIVVDSLTALQYFCMKGVDETVGAQTFLRFLSDLRVTTLLTVEAPLEDVESPERLLARGEIRLFRWELDGRTVRAIGVEKLRGSTHDIRLHPYRIHPKGIDINLEVTVSRDTRRIVEAAAAPVAPASLEPIAPILDNLSELEQEIRDLVAVGLNFPALRQAVGDVASVAATRPAADAMHEYQRLKALVHNRVEQFRQRYAAQPPAEPPQVALAARRLLSLAAEARTGLPPILASQLPALAGRLLALRDSIPIPGEVLAPPLLLPPPPTEGTLAPAPLGRPSLDGPAPPPPPAPRTVPVPPPPPEPTRPASAPPSGSNASPGLPSPPSGRMEGSRPMAPEPNPSAPGSPPGLSGPVDVGPPPLPSIPSPSPAPTAPSPPAPAAGKVPHPTESAPTVAGPTGAGPDRSERPADEDGRPSLPQVARPVLVPPPPPPPSDAESLAPPAPGRLASAPPVGAAAPKRRRRATAPGSVRRRTAVSAPPSPTDAGEPAGAGELPAPVERTDSLPVPVASDATAPPVEKPKRRAVRRRKPGAVSEGTAPSSPPAPGGNGAPSDGSSPDASASTEPGPLGAPPPAGESP